jgi:hypothetical protein
MADNAIAVKVVANNTVNIPEATPTVKLNERSSSMPNKNVPA